MMHTHPYIRSDALPSPPCPTPLHIFKLIPRKRLNTLTSPTKSQGGTQAGPRSGSRPNQNKNESNTIEPNRDVSFQKKHPVCKACAKINNEKKSSCDLSENLVLPSVEGLSATRLLWPAIPAFVPLLVAKWKANFSQRVLTAPHPTPQPSPVLSHVIRNAHNELPHHVGKVWCSWFYSFSVAFGILKDMFVLKKPILAGSAAGFGEPIDFSEPLTELGVRCFVRGDLEEDLRGKQ